jgi:hypothetical protein
MDRQPNDWRGRNLHMNKLIARACIGLTLAALAIAWTGCSDTTKIITSSTTPAASQIANYFPLTEGQSSVFSITKSGVTTETEFTIGSKVQIGNAQAVRWIIKADEAFDTSYFVATDSALYFLETPYADPEKILYLPLDNGQSWPRYYNYNVTGYSSGDVGTGYQNGGGDNPFGYKDTTGDGAAMKNFPSEGGNTFTVVGTESVSLGGALGTYAGALKIKNVGWGGSTNYYWYVPDLGLVKYELETNDLATGTPSATGVLVDIN